MSIQRLGDYIEQYSHKNKNDDPYPVYSVTNSEGFCTEYFNKDVSGKKKTNYKIVPKGYFAYNPSRINVGSIDWQNSEDNVIVSPIYVVFKCLKELDQDYLKYFIKSPEGIRMINSKVSGAVRNNLRFEDLSEFEFNIVEYDKQIEVVNMLKLIEKAIDNEKNQLKLYDELIKARFVELFGDVATEDYKYETKKLGDVAEVGSSHRVFTSEFVEEGIPFYRGTEIGELANGQKPADPYYISEEHYNRLANDETKPRVGDLLMPSICNKGQVWMVDTEEPFYYKDGRVLCISPDREIYNPKYLQYFMRAKTEVEYPKMGSGSTFAEFKIFLLKDFDILTPPKSIQDEFTAFVEQVDKSKVVVQERIKVYEELLNKKLYEYYIV